MRERETFLMYYDENMPNMSSISFSNSVKLTPKWISLIPLRKDKSDISYGCVLLINSINFAYYDQIIILTFFIKF